MGVVGQALGQLEIGRERNTMEKRFFQLTTLGIIFFAFLRLTLSMSSLILAGGLVALSCKAAEAVDLPPSGATASSGMGAVASTEDRGRSRLPEEALGVLTGYSGDVAVTLQPSAAELPARALMALGEGDRIRVAQDARAVIVCRTDTALVLDQSQQLSHELCAQGTPLPVGSFAVVEPRGGRIQRVAGSFAPEPTTRELPDDYGSFPVVLSPRQTALIEARPTVSWTEVPGAVDYEVKWSGPGFPAFAKRRDELRCRSDELFDGAVTTCSFDWPVDAAKLQEGGVYFLSVGAWREADLRPRISEETNKVRILDSQRAGQLRLVVDRTQALEVSIDKGTRFVIVAGFHLQDEVFAEAIPAYRQAVALQPSAKVYATLGDAYRRVHLYRFAAESYQQALQLAQEDAEWAAAEFGLGQVDFAWRRFRQAWEHFQIAQEIYDRLGLAEEAEAAAAVGSMAQQRIRQ